MNAQTAALAGATLLVLGFSVRVESQTEGATQPQAEEPAPAREVEAAPADDEEAPAPAELSPALREEIEAAARESASEEARRLQLEIRRDAERLDDQVGNLLGAMQVFVGVLAVVLAFFVGVLALVLASFAFLAAWFEVSAEKKRRLALQRAEDAAAAAGEAAGRVGEIEKRIQQGFGVLEVRKLPDISEEFVIGGTPPAIEPEVRIDFEDLDGVLVAADEMGLLPDGEAAASHFTEVAFYWFITYDFGRAQARLKRALELDPRSTKSRIGLARTLAVWGATERREAEPLMRSAEGRSRRKGRTQLERASVRLEEAKLLIGQVEQDENITRQQIVRILHLAAWILDEKGHLAAWIPDEEGGFEEAAAAYERAREKDRELAEEEGREEDWKYTYNLACCLAKKGDLEEGLEELKAACAGGRFWDQALEDPDLEPLRALAGWGEFFQEGGE